MTTAVPLLCLPASRSSSRPLSWLIGSMTCAGSPTAQSAKWSLHTPRTFSSCGPLTKASRYDDGCPSCGVSRICFRRYISFFPCDHIYDDSPGRRMGRYCARLQYHGEDRSASVTVGTVFNEVVVSHIWIDSEEAVVRVDQRL